MAPSFAVVSGLYVCVLGLIGAVFFLGDPDSSSPLGRLTYVCMVWVPVQAERALGAVPGGRHVLSLVSSIYTYVCYRPNPLLQIVYLALIIGGFIVFTLEGLPHIPNRYLGEVHLYTSHVAVLLTLLSFVRASTKGPGFVTARSHAGFDHYAYDGFLYVRRECSTCQLRKIPRSKHCSVCGACVATFDHHCPWINGCVGEKNHGAFMSFLVCTYSLLAYTSFGVAAILLDIVVEKRLMERHYVNRDTQERVPPSLSIVVTYLFIEKGLLVMLFIMAAVMGLVVFGFWGYHVSLVLRGTTTNEASKWSGIKGFYSSLAKDMKRCPEDFPARLAPLDPELEAKLVDPVSAPPLEERRSSQFPRDVPAHKYSLGWRANLARFFFPDQRHSGSSAPVAIAKAKAKAKVKAEARNAAAKTAKTAKANGSGNGGGNGGGNGAEKKKQR